MHSDVHLQLHALRAADLRTEAARFRPARARPERRTPERRTSGGPRDRLGWFLVDVGLHLVHRPPVRVARTA